LGKKIRLRGMFEKIGTKKNWKFGFLEETVLLIDIRNDASEIIADHLWLNYTKQLKNADLKKGDEIEFFGIVRTYQKGHVDFREGIDNRTIDYKITYPSKVKKVVK
jgi:hypothetical protein